MCMLYHLTSSFHSLVYNLPFPGVEDLVQDIGDGQALGVLIHNYLPKDLPLEG